MHLLEKIFSFLKREGEAFYENSAHEEKVVLLQNFPSPSRPTWASEYRTRVTSENSFSLLLIFTFPPPNSFAFSLNLRRQVLSKQFHEIPNHQHINRNPSPRSSLNLRKKGTSDGGFRGVDAMLEPVDPVPEEDGMGTQMLQLVSRISLLSLVSFFLFLKIILFSINGKRFDFGLLLIFVYWGVN